MWHLLVLVEQRAFWVPKNATTYLEREARAPRAHRVARARGGRRVGRVGERGRRLAKQRAQLARGGETAVDVADARRVEHDRDREIEGLFERRVVEERVALVEVVRAARREQRRVNVLGRERHRTARPPTQLVRDAQRSVRRVVVTAAVAVVPRADVVGVAAQQRMRARHEGLVDRLSLLQRRDQRGDLARRVVRAGGAVHGAGGDAVVAVADQADGAEVLVG